MRDGGSALFVASSLSLPLCRSRFARRTSSRCLASDPMKLVGITGGVGMGKSACTQLLRARAIPVVDTDELAREVVEPGQPALLEVQRLFGSDILDSTGRLRRDLLARRVFADPDLRKQLEAILHPRRGHSASFRDQSRSGIGRCYLRRVYAVKPMATAAGAWLARRTNRTTVASPMVKRRKDRQGRLCYLDRSLARGPRSTT